MLPLNNFQKTWKGLTLAQRFTLVAVPLAVLAGIVLVISVAGRPSYGVLFSNLAADDAGSVTEKLKEMKVDYRLADGGKAIEVPQDKVYDLRLSLASDGLPRGGSVGFELFDKTTFGATDFTQHLNYQRALQGELTRTINRLDGVIDSRVHVVIPEHRLFEDKEEPSTASIVLQLRPGYEPTQRQVTGIVHLISAAVEGLKPENVSVLDSAGNPLNTSGGDSPMLTDSQLQMQERYEGRLAQELQRVADEVLGAGKSAIRVSADLNWDQTDTTRETYRPAGSGGKNLPTEEQTSIEAYGKKGAGQAGITAAATAQIGPGGAEAGQYQNSQTTNKFVVNKIVEHQITAPGKVRRLSVAVLLDTSVTPDEQQGLKSAFAAAAGLDTDPVTAGGRGDRIELVPVKFDHSAETDAAKQADAAAQQGYRAEMLRDAAAVAVALIVSIVSLVLYRRMRAARYAPFEALITDSGPTAAIAGDTEAPRLAAAANSPARAPAIERLQQLASERPEQVARQLQTWIVEQ